MSSKRRAAASAGPSQALEGTEGPASKRRKTQVNDEETPEETTKLGLRFLDQIKNARDKGDRLIATFFLFLPDRKKTPNYYQKVGLPVALDTVEAKLNNNEYTNMTSLEGDLRRMISNAKAYNEKRSQAFSDSEKIRKQLQVFMQENNPAYNDPSYVPYNTPIPQGWQVKQEKPEDTHEQDAEGETDPEVAKPPEKRTRLVTRVGSSAAANDRRASSTPAVQDVEGAYESFDGNTFQQAQEKIVGEMINHTDAEDQAIFAPFIHLPPRTLVDYYKVIKHPVSLKSVQKLVRGIKGREPPTGSTFLKSWHAFEEEVSYIWNNARDYNEDGSDLFVLSEELESYFHTRLAEAKRSVAEPPQPKVKLRMPAKSPEPPKITLKFGGQKATGSASMSVDNESLKRQQELVRAGVNGYAPGKGSIPTPASSRLSHERSGSAEHAMSGMKTETAHGQSPALNAIPNGSSEARQSPSASNLQMPPPMHVSSRMPSDSPNPHATPSAVAPTSQASNTPFNSRLRQPGKDVSDALIANLNISTHPGLNIKDHLSLDIPASPTHTQQSRTITVPYTHFFLRITPTVSSSLMHRPSKTIVSCGNNRLEPTRQAGEPDPRRPVYETRLVPGVNSIEVEIIAGPPRGAPKVGSGQDIEFEKITVFVHLQKMS
ncbi:hypothetical protein HO173_008405 [Letharia columbiana]|uniref:Bromo domain-containing protein n=1 Tax=Letharia columbiana TaxID=112416 RepID=A0A8H6L2W2_9LECA|nr:uncharacterized protein HO173_008405 [Letharia columbiana]KAF6233473.1 hypothetical protein HO173_008405 [Letharia columbiana]